MMIVFCLEEQRGKLSSVKMLSAFSIIQIMFFKDLVTDSFNIDKANIDR